MFSFGRCPITPLPLILVTTVTTSGVVLIQVGVLSSIRNSKFWPILALFGQFTCQVLVLDGRPDESYRSIGTYHIWPIEASEYRFRGKVSVLHTWDQVFWPVHLNPLTCIPEKVGLLFLTPPSMPVEIHNPKVYKKYPNILVVYG